MSLSQVAWAALAVFAAYMLLFKESPPMWLVWLIIFLYAAMKAWPR
jgi:hypothetical protein